MAEASGKASSRKFLTDVELKALKPGQTATDSLPGRGSGSILFDCRASGAVEAYYRRRDEGGQQKIKLGVFKKTPKSPGLSLTELREQAVPLYRDQLPAVLSAFVPLRATPKRPTAASVIIELSLGEQSVTVKWPVSDPDGCARFVRGLAP